MWTIPTLNTRETATVFWSAVLVAFILIRPDTRAAARDSVHVAFRRPLVWLILATVAYVAIVVGSLDLIGFWRSSMIGETAFWFLGSAPLAVAGAQLTKSGTRKTLLRLLALSAAIEFLANTHTFALPVELVVILVLALIAASRPLADTNPDLHAAATPLKVLTRIAIALVLGSALIYVTDHLARFETTEYVRALLLPLILSLILAPFAYAVRLLIVWQSCLMMLKFDLADRQSLYPYVRRRLIRLSGLSLAKVQLFEDHFRRRLRGALDRAAADTILLEFKAAAPSETPERADDEAIEWEEALNSGVDIRRLLAYSVESANRAQTELQKAASALGEPQNSVRALAERLDQLEALNATSPIVRARLIRRLAEKSRSLQEIELMAGPVGQLAVVEGVDPLWLADRFDAILRATGDPAGASYQTAATLHGAASCSTLTIKQVIDALTGDADATAA